MTDARTGRRGTSNSAVRGSASDRAARREYLVVAFGWPSERLVCCYRCDVPLLQDEDPEAPGQSVQADRIVPGCEGGTYGRGNIRPACGPCNRETGFQTQAEQRRRRAQTT